MNFGDILRDFSVLVPRIGLGSVSITEIGETGFGDRLRGIGIGLFLARIHRVSVLYYDEQTQTVEVGASKRQFPFDMCELIRLNGVELREGAPPASERTLSLLHNCEKISKLNLFGFNNFWRVEPRNSDIIRRLDQVGVDRSCIGFHVRGTDALDSFRFFKGEAFVEQRAIENLKTMSKSCDTKKLFLASDSRATHESWFRKLTDLGYDVKANSSVDWKPGELRETGAEDMLVDFFGLARCCKVVRLVPSEFSRYAAWKAGQKLRYLDLV